MHVLGLRLMETAEQLAALHGYKKIAVISGIGTRNYYRKLGYDLHPGLGGFMIKKLPWSIRYPFLPYFLAVFVALLSWAMYHLMLVLSIV